MAIKLKKCPFCGKHGRQLRVEEYRYFGGYYAQYRVVCSHCDSMGPKTASNQSAREAWNTRAEVQDEQE